jgi:ubiquinol-cytochrome c reductase cytochrome b subunit
VVTTQIASQAPLAGPYLTRLLGSEGSVGVVTFARFYGMHVMLLPLITVLLIAVHIYLVRRHGVAPAPGDEFKRKQQFYPVQVFRDTVAIFIAFAILFTLAVAARVPLERLADPTDTTYIPRPEWYFLFLFQTLKFFEGPLEVVGSMVLPGLAILALILTPFLDRSQMVRAGKRTVAFGILALAAIGWGGLTAAAVATTPKEALAVDVDYSAPTDWLQLSAEEMAGIGYFRAENCQSCHAVGGGDSSPGPDLAGRKIKRNAAWMIAHFKRPSAQIPGTSMPPVSLPDAQLNSLAAFLLKLNERNASALQNAPEFAVKGAMVYQAQHCGACHVVNNMGMKVGPPLNGLSKRRTSSWVERHFVEPQALSPGTIMPVYKLPPQQMKDLTQYLMTLPD